MKYKEYSIGELLDYEQPSKYIVKSTDYSDKYKIPVLTAGKTFIIGYTNEIEGIFDKYPVIIFDDFTTATQLVNFKFKVKSSAMKILKPKYEWVNIKYMYYLMQSIRFEHSTHKRYWLQHYSKIKIQIPSSEEQKRIVSRIEELFSELDNGVENLKKAKAQLDVYRQAVLKEAFGMAGDSYIKLGDIIEKPKYGTSKKCTYAHDSDEYKGVYRIPNINTKNGTINHDDLKYANFSQDELKDIDLKYGDILLIRSNGSISLVGRTAVIRKKDLGNVFAGYLIRIRCKKTNIHLSQYIHYYLSSHTARCYIENTAKSTSGVNNINAQEIKNIKIPVCDNIRIKNIVDFIEEKLSACENIEKTINTALQQAETMRQSILKQAFEGRL